MAQVRPAVNSARHQASRRTHALVAAATLVWAVSGAAAHPETECRSAEQARAARCYAVEQPPAVNRLIEASERTKARPHAR